MLSNNCCSSTVFFSWQKDTNIQSGGRPTGTGIGPVAGDYDRFK